MRRSLPILVVTAGALLLAATFLKGLAGEGEADPTVSVNNGAAAGTLGLALWLERRGVDVVRWTDHAARLPDGRALFVAPPPAASAWNEDEVETVLARVTRGDYDLLVVCDEQRGPRARMDAWWSALGVTCGPRDDVTSVRARGTLPAYDAELAVRGHARVGPEQDHRLVPAWVDEQDNVVALRRREGANAITVLATPTVLANDGIAHGDNARFFLSLVPAGARVVFDEAHHTFRGQQTLSRAFAGTGPRIGMLALLLLVPCVVLGFAPRRGDPPAGAREPPFLAARRSAEALAALYVRAGVRAPAREAPPGPEAVDRTRQDDGRSAA